MVAQVHLAADAADLYVAADEGVVQLGVLDGGLLAHDGVAQGVAGGLAAGHVDVVSARDMERFVLGVDGSADFFGTRWAYNGYVAFGTNHTRIDVNDISLTPRYNAAIDAIRLRAFPFAPSVAEFIARHEQVFVVEQNRDAQMRSLLMTASARQVFTSRNRTIRRACWPGASCTTSGWPRS